MNRLITDRLPTKSDGDFNGEVMSYDHPDSSIPVPSRSVWKLSGLGFCVGWRRIHKGDYKREKKP